MQTSWAALLAFALLTIASGCKKRTTSTPPAPEETATPAAVGSPAPENAAPKRGTFTIGKSTTYALGPLDATGHVDYATALHERASKGVTADNNANVSLWKIIGPTTPDGTKVSSAHFRMMGMTPPSVTGEYFIGLGEYSNKFTTDKVDTTALAALSTRPWAENEQGTVCGWLRANAKPLTALRDAVRAPQFYNPISPTEAEKGLSGTLLPGVTTSRELAGALACRAMLSLGRGEPDEAWQDIIACHRLGRLVGRGSTLIEGVVAMAIEHVACRAEVAFLGHARLDARATESCLRDLIALPLTPNTAAQIDFGERLWFLDTIMQIDKRGWAGVHPTSN